MKSSISPCSDPTPLGAVPQAQHPASSPRAPIKIQARKCKISRLGEPPTSEFKGVYLHGQMGQWCANITLPNNGGVKYLGSFGFGPDGELEAALAYNAAATKIWGDRARLN